MTRREGTRTDLAENLDRLNVYLTSAYGLILLTMGFGDILSHLLRRGYHQLFEETLVLAPPSLWDTGVRESLSMFVVGAAWWGFHWLWVSRKDTISGFQQTVVFVLGILGGLLTTVAATSIILRTALQWLINRPESVSAASFFDVTPGALAAGITGAAVWSYHSSIALRQKDGGARVAVSAGRIYRYLSAGVGLGTFAAGLVLLLAVVIRELSQVGESFAGERPWASPLATALTLLIAGGPLWIGFWTHEQIKINKGPQFERQATARRVFIFGAFGTSVLMALGGLSQALFSILQPMLEGTFSSDAMNDARWGIAATITAVLGAVYHWRVLQADRESIAQAQPAPPESPGVSLLPKRLSLVVLLASPEETLLEKELEAQPDVQLIRWSLEDKKSLPALSMAQVTDLKAEILAQQTEKVLVLVESGTVRVIPFREEPRAAVRVLNGGASGESRRVV